MTVRINKSAFNIREKLSELERPIGVKGNELMRAETAQEAGALLGVGRKNLIINGDMRVAQRGTSAVSTNNQYPVDRWVLSNTDGADIQIQQSTDVPVGEGFRNSIKWSVNSTSNTTGSQSIRQHIEVQDSKDLLGWGSSTGKFATLSFWIKGSHNGTVTASVRESINASVCYLHLTEVTTGWTKHSFTIPHTPNGTWSSTANLGGVTVIFAFDRHSTANGTTLDKWVTANHINNSNQTEWITISGAEIYITGVQLEVGKNATEFEHRSYGEELALCQRYFFKTDTDNAYSQVANGMYTTNNVVKCVVQHPVSMRTRPTVSVSPGQTNTFYAQQGDAALTTSGATFSGQWTAGSGVLKSWLDFNNVPNGTQGYAVAIYRANGNGALDFSAEL